MPINPNNLMSPISPMAPLQPLQFGANGDGWLEDLLRSFVFG